MSTDTTRNDGGPDFTRYQCYEEHGDVVIRDREEDGAWIRSNMAFEIRE